MSLLESILMGLIQGLTEFLPVSSSGHLAIFKILFGVNTPGLLFDVLLHLGTLIAVFACYYRDIFKMIWEFILMIRDFFLDISIFIGRHFKGQSKNYHKLVSNGYRKFDLLIIVATIPTGIIGVVDSDFVEKAQEILIFPGICLLITGVLLLISDRLKDGNKTPKNTTYSNAFIIGICQGIATLPGISRSGTTITACLASGFNRSYAVKYSFILSIPAILGSLVFELGDVNVSAIPANELTYYLIGTVVAAIVGYICIKTMLVIVKKKKFTYFAIYCFIAGALSIGGYFYMA